MLFRSIARSCFGKPQLPNLRPGNRNPAEPLACLSIFVKCACSSPLASWPLLLSTPRAGVGVPLPVPVRPRTAPPANFSSLPIEPPRTPRTIRGDGRVLLPRAVPAARNVTRRRPAPIDGPCRVRRVGTGQTPAVCRRQQEGHPAAPDHTPRTDPLNTACSSTPGHRACPGGGGHGQGALRGAVSAGRGHLGGVPRRSRRSSAGPGAGSARPRRVLPASGAGYTRGPRSFSGAGSAGRPSSPSPLLCGLTRQGLPESSGPPGVDTLTQCVTITLPRVRIRLFGEKCRPFSSGRGSRPGRACRTAGPTRGPARPRRGTCRRSPGPPAAATGRSRSTACRAG